MFTVRFKVRVRVRVRVRVGVGVRADADAEHAARALLRGELLPLALRVVERARLLVAGLEDRDACADGGGPVEG